MKARGGAEFWEGFVKASALSPYFDGNAKARQRWFEGLSPEYRKSTRFNKNYRHFVKRRAVLPNGETVGDYLRGRELGGPPATPPAAVIEGNAYNRKRWAVGCEVVERFQRLLRQRPELSATTSGVDTFLSLYSGWLKDHGVPRSRSGFLSFVKKIQDGAVPDRRRGNSGRRRAAEYEPAREQFEALYLKPSRPSAASAAETLNAMRYQQGERPVPPHVWRRWADEIPHAAKVMARQGQRAYRAKCEPKLQRDYEDILAGEWWCGDSRTFDFWGKVPDARCEWRPARFVLSAFCDMRSRVFVGWEVSVTENSDAILAAIKGGIIEYGAPAHCIVDNGEGFKAATGTPRGTKRQRDYFADERVGSVFALTGTQVHNALPYHPQSKQIESLFAKTTDFCKLFKSYCGGSPDARPEDVTRYVKAHVDELPTRDEVRDAFAVWLDGYHATPQSGRGTRGLPPQIVMEQFRGPIRRVDAVTLDLICSRVQGPVTVGRDGVKVGGVLYGHFDDDVIRLQGRKVWARIFPDDASRIALCAEDGTPLAYAHNERMLGATQEDVREAAKRTARARKRVKGYLREREVLLTTPTQQVLKVRAEAAQAKLREQRKTLPPAAEPAVQLVRPDLTEQVAKLNEREQRRQGRASRAASKVGRNGVGGAAKPAAAVESPFDLLHQQQQAEAAAARPQAKQVSIEDLYSEVTDDDWGTTAAAREAEARKAQEEFDRIYGGAESPREAAG